jgi:endonuclease YncB( thermonuclease family)
MGAQLVTEGWALAYRRYSTEYVDEEAAARKSGAGMWAMQYQPPRDWLRHSRFSFH